MSESDVKDKITTSIGGNINNENQQDKVDTAQKTKDNEMSTKEAYFASLNAWVKSAECAQNAMAMFPWYLLASYPHMFPNYMGISGSIPQPTAATSGQAPQANGQPFQNNQETPNLGANGPENYAIGSLRILNDQAQAELINRMGGYEYIIAPFWKRALAETIDIVLLLITKLVVTFTIVNLFDLDLGLDVDKDLLRKALDEDDYTNFFAVSLDFIAFSSDLLLLETLTKIIVCLYEAIWTTVSGGATPGKAIMGLRVLYVEGVLPLQAQQPPQQQFGFQGQRPPMRALIYPAKVPTLKRAFVRALIKNIIMTLLFPICFVMMFFKNNRTAYDILAKTMVVEANPNRVLRRPN